MQIWGFNKPKFMQTSYMSGPYGCCQRLEDSDGGVLQLLQRARFKVCLALFLRVLLVLLAGDACQVLCGGVPLAKRGTN